MTDWEDKIAYLNLTSFSGFLAGASHWYASINFGDESIDLDHALSRGEAASMNKSDGKDFDGDLCWSPGDVISRYDSEERAIKVAEEKWRELAPDARVLIKGSSSYAEPQPVLDGLSHETIDKLNALYQKCEELGWWDSGNDKEVKAAYEDWKKILIEEMG